MVLGLLPDERHRGIVTASTGNHGAGVSFAALRTGCEATVFVPTMPTRRSCNRSRKTAPRSNGGDDCVDTEFNARAFASEHDRAYIPPYNHPDIIAGQGTIGLELADQIPDLNAVFVAVGGGGLIAGVSRALKSLNPDIEVIACSPENSCVMHQSLAGTLSRCALYPQHSRTARRVGSSQIR